MANAVVTIVMQLLLLIALMLAAISYGEALERKRFHKDEMRLIYNYWIMQLIGFLQLMLVIFVAAGGRFIGGY
jgi:hypothetical protein